MVLNLTLEQKARLLAILPVYEQKPVGRKRCDTVQVFLGILWVLVTGARWEDIDKRTYASRQTCQRYFAQWVQAGVFEKALLALARELEDAGLLDLHESFIDGSFVEAKKGALRLA
jgi:transposase